MKKITKGYKKWSVIDTKDYLEKKKMRKEKTKDRGTRTCLKKTNQNQQKARKIEFEVCPKKIYNIKQNK